MSKDLQTNQQNNQVRVRFAPSPTGFMHIGGVRTALFNYLFAKKHKGVFILRLEDTDRERYIEEAVGNIIEALNWLGLKYQEGPEIKGEYGPYIQSERLELYKKHAEELLKKDRAYQDEGSIRFKTLKEGQTTWHDLIGDERGSHSGKGITFLNSTQEDFVILKTDGFPTYNFANVIDDHYMQITHVIRGPEFISSTPKHLMLYKSFDWTPPQFAHVPVILGPDKSKLSKRHGAKPVLEFREDGFLPEALLNYMALLGWAPPSGNELLSLEQMVEEFDIKDVNVSSPVFDLTKLEWINGEYIRKLSDQELGSRITQSLMQIGWTKAAEPEIQQKINQLAPLVKERIKKLTDFVPLTDFIFEKAEYDQEVFDKILKKQQVDLGNTMNEIASTMENLSTPWDAKQFEERFRALADKLGLSASEMFQLIRAGVSGQLVTPPLFESIQILGEQETISRIKNVIPSLDK